MKHFISALLIGTLYISAVSAQETYIQGSVSHNGRPLEQAKIMEMDVNHRILNQTYSDSNGHFVLKVTGGKTSLRVTAPGMRKFTQKINHATTWQVNMKKDHTPEESDKAKARYETTKLLVGRMNDRAIPQISWVEQLTDTTYTLVVPVRMPTMVEEYPIGRKLTVTDFNGHAVAIGKCIEEAVPEEGLPKSWDPFIRVSTNNSADNASPFTTDDRDYFAYPRFSFTKAEMEYMIDHSTELACFAVDTSRGDNFWIYYPATSFARELQKILNRMQK
ncbi:MAG: carboxypeptidase-like regulatory domain-containing protein [Bacteroides sp.]|nr:carboxypeptidase-like regulatory domain-containing protein [Bacteroides sp.]MCM1448271.1 carboxypeptidase-like regulatory domain-containing protein [Bacteroides sp.]